MPEAMPSRARAASRLVDVLDASILQLLAVPARVDVLRVLLVHGGADVGTIASHLPLDRSVVSRHLKAFDDAGLVRVTRDGRHRRFALDGGALVAALDRLAVEARAAVAVCGPPGAQ